MFQFQGRRLTVFGRWSTRWAIAERLASIVIFRRAMAITSRFKANSSKGWIWNRYTKRSASTIPASIADLATTAFSSTPPVLYPLYPFASSRLLKKTHMLRCAQSPRYNVLAKYASARRFSRASPLSLFEQPAIRVFSAIC